MVKLSVIFGKYKGGNTRSDGIRTYIKVSRQGDFFMMSKLKEIFFEKLRLSGIRGCMAAGAMTAGIAALAVIGGVNSEDISTVSLETDVIPEETVAEAVTEKKTYAHDMEYISAEDMEKMIPEEKEEPSEAGEINAAAAPVQEAASEEEETVPAETEVPAEETAAETEEAVCEESSDEEEAISYEEESSEAEETAYSEVLSEDIADSEENEEPSEDEELSDDSNDNEVYEEESEKTESVSARYSAAGGDEDDGGLSSALDIEPETYSEAPETSEYIIIYSEAENETEAEADMKTFKSSVEENVEAASDENDNNDDIPEDITLDDDDETEKAAPAPQEGAISLFDLPEWLTFDENGIPAEYTKVLTGNACAYTAAPDALMSTGKAVFQGYVAVDPNVIPYGTELYIVAEDGEVYGYAIAADTGGSVRRGEIIVDLFMNEYDDCIQWGNKPVYVYVLK